MPRSNKGQSLINTAIVLTVVIATGVMMFPYLRESWNAFLMSYEEEIDASQNDPFINDPNSTGFLPGCVCSPMLVQGCGDGTCGKYERLITRTCTGANCPASQEICREDPSCCDDPIPQCDPTTGDVSCCGPNATPECPDGHSASSVQCGNGLIKTECTPNVLCEFQCKTVIDRAEPCVTPPEPGLPDNLDYHLVDRCAAPPHPPGSIEKCEAICETFARRKGDECVGCPKKPKSSCRMEAQPRAAPKAPANKWCDPSQDPKWGWGCPPSYDCSAHPCNRDYGVVEAYCSDPETELVGGFCTLAHPDRDGGGVDSLIGTPLGQNGWRCTADLHSVSCAATYCNLWNTAFVWCYPKKGCPRPVLKNFLVTEGLTNCPAPLEQITAIPTSSTDLRLVPRTLAGREREECIYHRKEDSPPPATVRIPGDTAGALRSKEVTLFDDWNYWRKDRSANYCEQIKHYAPHPLCKDQPKIPVIGNVFLMQAVDPLGRTKQDSPISSLSHPNLNRPQKDPIREPGFFYDSYDHDEWEEFAWIYRQRARLFFKKEAVGHCFFDGCPASLTKTVIADIAFTHTSNYADPTGNNPIPACSTLGPGWEPAGGLLGRPNPGRDHYNRVRFCIKKQQICVHPDTAF